MSNTPKSLTTWVLTSGFAASLALAGCTRHPNEEQLQTLEETKQAALAAEQQAQQCDSEKASLASQLDQKKRELKDAQDEKAAVQSRLGM